MPVYWCCLIVLVGIVSYVRGADIPGDDNAEYRKEIAAGVSIVIKRSSVDSELLESLLPAMAREGGRPFAVSAELHAKDQHVVLASSVLAEGYGAVRSGFEIRDVAYADGELVVICTVGDRIGLWLIPADAAQASVAGGWYFALPSRYAAAVPLDRDSVDVTLEHPKQGRWSFTATDRRVGGAPTTVFTQVPGSWRFEASSP